MQSINPTTSALPVAGFLTKIRSTRSNLCSCLGSRPVLYAENNVAFTVGKSETSDRAWTLYLSLSVRIPLARKEARRSGHYRPMTRTGSPPAEGFETQRRLCHQSGPATHPSCTKVAPGFNPAFVGIELYWSLLLHCYARISGSGT